MTQALTNSIILSPVITMETPETTDPEIHDLITTFNLLNTLDQIPTQDDDNDRHSIYSTSTADTITASKINRNAYMKIYMKQYYITHAGLPEKCDICERVISRIKMPRHKNTSIICQKIKQAKGIL